MNIYHYNKFIVCSLIFYYSFISTPKERCSRFYQQYRGGKKKRKTRRNKKIRKNRRKTRRI